MQSIVKMIATRLALGVLVLLAVSVIIFASVEALPGDIAVEILGQNATPEAVAAIRRDLGLDIPAIPRYLAWISGVVQGDFGNSLANQRPISELMGTRLSNTAFLAAFTAAISVPLALTLGILLALFRDTTGDRVTNASGLAAVSVPEFFLAYVLVYLFSSKLGWLPAISNINPDMTLLERMERTLLPAITLTLVVSAHMMRMTRTAIIDLLEAMYVEQAYLKGLSRRRVILVHALPNALTPIINVVMLNLAYLVVGVVVVEVVFVYPGLGQLMVDSVAARDVPVVQTCCLVFSATFVLLNLLADVLAQLTNPRLLHPR